MASKTLPPSPKITMANGHQMMIKLSSVMMAASPFQLIKLKMAQKSPHSKPRLWVLVTQQIQLPKTASPNLRLLPIITAL